MTSDANQKRKIQETARELAIGITLDRLSYELKNSFDEYKIDDYKRGKAIAGQAVEIATGICDAIRDRIAEFDE